MSHHLPPPASQALVLPRGFHNAELQYLHAMLVTASPIGSVKLLVDQSSSMGDLRSSVLELMAANVRDLRNVRSMARRTFASIMYFADGVEIVVPPTRVVNLAAPLHYNPGGLTALIAVTADAIEETLSFMDVIRAYCEARGFVVPELRCAICVMTDGADTVLSSLSRRPELLRLSAKAIWRGVTLSGIAIGKDPTELEELLGFPKGSFQAVAGTPEGVRVASQATSSTMTTTILGCPPVPVQPAPISPTGTVHGQVVSIEDVPTGPFPGKV